jgi:hypothetical protein
MKYVSTLEWLPGTFASLAEVDGKFAGILESEPLHVAYYKQYDTLSEASSELEEMTSIMNDRWDDNFIFSRGYKYYEMIVNALEDFSLPGTDKVVEKGDVLRIRTK